MTGITAQVSLYPLPPQAVAPELATARHLFPECAVQVEPSLASNTLVGDDTTIFAALQQAFYWAAEQGQVVMVVMLSNACPARAESPNDQGSYHP